MIKNLHFTRSLAIAALVIFMLLPGLGWGQTIIFTESMGTAPVAVAIATHEAANGFDNDSYTMTGKPNPIPADFEVRNTTASNGYTGASGLANVFFTSALGTFFQIEGINTTGYTGLSLSLGHFKTNIAANNQLAIEVSSDGSTWTPLTYTRATGAGTAVWLWITPTGTIPATSNLRIRFKISTAGYTFRVDDIKLTGFIAPALTADASSNNVDNNIDITFTDDEAWRGAVTAVKIGGFALTQTTDYVLSAGNIQLKPSGLNPLLTTSGSKAVTVESTNYPIASVAQVINAGADYKLGIKTQPTAPATNGAVLAVQPEVYIQDQYGNTTSSTATVVASVGAGTWTLGGTYSVAAFAGTTTYSGLTASSANAVTGATITFTSGSLLGVTSNTFDIPATSTPSAFNVTGTGSYCSTGSGLTIGLSGSETGVNYTLIKDGTPTATIVAGTGSAISFGTQTLGNYTATGTADGSVPAIAGTTTMTGSAVITTVDPPTAFAGGMPAYAIVSKPYLISNSSATNYTTLTWSTNKDGFFDNSNILHPTYTQFSGVGQYVTLTLTASNSVCPDAISAIDLLMIPAGNSKTWNGTNTSWADPNNWTTIDGSVPLQTTDVIIPSGIGNYPIISSTAVCKDLTIYPGATLTIAAGNSLSVSGTIAKDAVASGLIIESGASLLHSTAGVNAQVKRAITGDWSTWDAGWHFISSPVGVQPIPAVTGNYDFYGWNEALNLWMNSKDGGFSSWNGGTSFNIGQGYMISVENTQEVLFSGSLNVGNVTKTNLSLSNGANYSWHLLGNPYCSALSWNDGNWALSNVAGGAKIWNGSGKSYSDIAPGSIIPSAQGFMVSVNNPINAITIPAGSRTNNTQAWYKSSEESQQIILLASEQDNRSYQESKILINSSATTGFDFDYDSRFLAGYAPQFYSVSGSELLSTNSLPAIDGPELISFGFVKNQASSFKIELKETFANLRVYLTDKKTNTMQDLSDNPVYSFTSADGDDANRFELSFLDITKVPEPSAKENFTVYLRNGNINIASPANVNAEILVTNLVGQVVMRGKTGGNALTTLNAGILQNGVYVVSLIGNNKVVSKKVVVNK